MAKSNMSAQLIRNLVAKQFDCDPCDVILSGEIKPDYIATTSKHTAFNCDWEQETTLYAMYKDSFETVDEVVDYMSTDGYESSHISGTPLYKTEKAQEAILFVEVSAHASNEWIQEIRVYKPANFQEKLARVTKEDINRWEQWLLND